MAEFSRSDRPVLTPPRGPGWKSPRSVTSPGAHRPDPHPRPVEELERDSRLATYQYLPAIKADLLRRLGREADAAVLNRGAIELTANEAEHEFLADRLA